MKKKQIVELHSKLVDQLKRLIEKAEEELVKLRIDLGAGKLKDIHQVKKKRRDLARIKTILKEKELNEAI